MVVEFLPPEIAQLREPESIAMAKLIRRSPIITRFAAQPIATAYGQQGQGGLPILLLHGFDSSLLEWRRLMPQLSVDRSTWAVDLLGFGFSDRPHGSFYTPPAIKEHLYYTWDTLIGQPVILVGASMGGAVAIDFCLTYPDVVRKLVLIDSAGFTAGPNLSWLMLPGLGYLATEFLRHPRVRRQVSLQAYANPGLVTPDAELCAALHLTMPRWREALITFTKSGGYNFLESKIAQLTVPTLILWGDGDRILGVQDAERFQQTIADSQLAWIPQCGHVPHLEQPGLTAHHILQFAAA